LKIERKMERKIKIAVLVFLLIAIAVSAYWLITLQIAHSSFNDYYRFRGCVQLINRTADYGYCTVGSGETIKIVKFQDKWYLDGDLPGSGIF
jgi:hypothetical protein